MSFGILHVPITTATIRQVVRDSYARLLRHVIVVCELGLDVKHLLRLSGVRVQRLNCPIFLTVRQPLAISGGLGKLLTLRLVHWRLPIAAHLIVADS